MTSWTDEQLNAYRQKCDPVGDGVIEQILQAGMAAEINLMVTGLVENDDLVPDMLPSYAQAYFERSDDLPAWADLAQVRRGQAFFNRYAPEIALMLSLASLPICYGCGDGAQVLWRTRRIGKPANRRILETTQFVLDVMEVGGLEAQTDLRGLRSIQKVRLMHAAIRYFIQHPRPDRRGEPWDPAWGAPINQEDMVNTLMSFSRVPINGLRNLGYRFTAQEEEDYFHAWRVIGHLMGIDEDLNPPTASDGQALLEQICRRNFRWSVAGQELTEAVIDYIKEVVPMQFYDGLAVSILRRACGDELADMLRVPPADWTRHTLVFSDVLARVEGLVDRDLGREKVFAFLGRQLLLGFLTMERAKPAAFRIPPSLTQNWVNY